MPLATALPAFWQRLAGVRSQLLAVFVVFHVLSVGVLSLPASGRLGDRAVWQSPENQAQFAQWAQLARRLGLALDAAQLEDLAWRLTSRYLRIRSQLVAPFEPYARSAGLWQSWRMFSNPQSHPVYLHVELQRGAELEPLYVSRSSRYTWRREQLDHHRVRKLFGRVGRSTDPLLWEEFGAWAARQAARDFPDATELRLWQERRPTPEPGSSGAAGAQPEKLRVYDLRPLR